MVHNTNPQSMIYSITIDFFLDLLESIDFGIDDISHPGTEDAFPATPGLTGAELLASLNGGCGDLDGRFGSACHGNPYFSYQKNLKIDW